MTESRAGGEGSPARKGFTTVEGSTAVERSEPLAVAIVGAGRAMSSLIKPAFTVGPVKSRHVLLLGVLAKSSPVTQQRLIEALRVDASVLVGLLNELEGADLVSRVRDPRDRRRHLVEISARGRDLYTGVLGDIQRAGQPALAFLENGEREVLLRVLPLLIDAARVATAADHCSEPT